MAGVLHLIMLYLSQKHVKIKLLKYSLPINKIYPKITTIYFKNHNLLQSILHSVNTRYT